MRHLAVLLAAGLALAGCTSSSDSGPAAAGPAPSAVVSPALPTPAPSPTAVASPAALGTPAPTGTRTVEQLEAQVTITAPTPADPDQAAALKAYTRFATDFVVMTGLPDPNYAPAVDAIEPSFRTAFFDSARQVIKRGELILGPYSEQVKATLGGATQVLISTCVDTRRRGIFSASSGIRNREQLDRVVPLVVTMVRPNEDWQVAGYAYSSEVKCT